MTPPGPLEWSVEFITLEGKGFKKTWRIGLRAPAVRGQPEVDASTAVRFSGPRNSTR